MEIICIETQIDLIALIIFDFVCVCVCVRSQRIFHRCCHVGTNHFFYHLWRIQRKFEYLLEKFGKISHVLSLNINYKAFVFILKWMDMQQKRTYVFCIQMINKVYIYCIVFIYKVTLHKSLCPWCLDRSDKNCE